MNDKDNCSLQIRCNFVKNDGKAETFKSGGWKKFEIKKIRAHY